MDVTANSISDTVKECMELSLILGELVKDIGVNFRVFVKSVHRKEITSANSLICLS